MGKVQKLNNGTFKKNMFQMRNSRSNFESCRSNNMARIDKTNKHTAQQM